MVKELFDQFPEIQADSFQLRSIRNSDIDDLAKIFDDIEVQKYFFLSEEHTNNIRKLFQDYIHAYSSKREITWVLVAANEKPIGFLNSTFFYKDGFAFSKIAYVLSAAHRGKGYITRSLQHIINLLEKHSVVEIQADVSYSNTTSQKILKELGFGKHPVGLVDLLNPNREFRHLWRKKLISDKDRYFLLAVSSYENGDYVSSMKYFSEAIILDPTDSLLYNNRGTVFVQLDKYSQAYQDFQKAYELGLRNEGVRDNLRLVKEKLKIV